MVSELFTYFMFLLFLILLLFIFFRLDLYSLYENVDTKSPCYHKFKGGNWSLLVRLSRNGVSGKITQCTLTSCCC